MIKLPFTAIIATSWLHLGNLAEAQEVIIQKKPVQLITSSSPEIFPETWHTPSVAAAGQPLPEDQFERARSILSKTLAKYPVEVLASDLKAIYVLAELRYRGVITSGTNSRTCVYLKLGSEKAGFTAAHIEGVFHAEFSSILLRNHATLLDTKAWREANPADFQYLGDGVDAVKQGKVGRAYQEALLEKGFLSEYGCSTLENDFNGMAAKLFAGDASLWAMADRYPGIKKKLNLALTFYQKLDPTFTEAFFKSQAIPKKANR